jgi:hypothetical protein
VIKTQVIESLPYKEALIISDLVSVFPDGTGYDLKQLSSANYFEAQTNQSLSFYFHACGDTKILPNFGDNVTNACANEGYSLCMLSVSAPINGTVQKNASVLGKFDGLDFKLNRLMFPHPQTNKIATIILECAPESNETVLYAPLKIDTNQIVRKSIFDQVFSLKSSIFRFSF